MRRNIKIKPSKQASIPRFIVGILFVLMGIISDFEYETKRVEILKQIK